MNDYILPNMDTNKRQTFMIQREIRLFCVELISELHGIFNIYNCMSMQLANHNSIIFICNMSTLLESCWNYIKKKSFVFVKTKYAACRGNFWIRSEGPRQRQLCQPMFTVCSLLYAIHGKDFTVCLWHTANKSIPVVYLLICFVERRTGRSSMLVCPIYHQVRLGT